MFQNRLKVGYYQKQASATFSQKLLSELSLCWPFAKAAFCMRRTQTLGSYFATEVQFAFIFVNCFSIIYTAIVCRSIHSTICDFVSVPSKAGPKAWLRPVTLNTLEPPLLLRSFQMLCSTLGGGGAACNPSLYIEIFASSSAVDSNNCCDRSSMPGDNCYR